MARGEGVDFFPIRLPLWVYEPLVGRTWRCWAKCMNHGCTRMDTDNAKLALNAWRSQIRVYPCASVVKNNQLTWSVRA